MILSNKNKIKNISARQILDSRGYPTLEVVVKTIGGSEGRASVPSGASTGKNEAVELRDGGNVYFGKGVLQAVENINTKINKILSGISIQNQKLIDETLIEIDGTENKEVLGGNAIIGVSIACAKTASIAVNLPFYKYINQISGSKKIGIATMPKILFNLINGGKHANSNLDIQEYHFIPLANNIANSVRMGSEVYQMLGKLLKSRNLSTATGDEGGYAPKFEDNEEPFKLILESATKCGYKQGEDFGIGIDAAANSFSELSTNNDYIYTLESNNYNTDEIIKLYQKWIDVYKLILIEDGLSEEDEIGWEKMTKIFKDQAHVINKNMEIVGDDLFVTNAKRLVDGVEKKMASAVIIKPNQVGTLSETFQTIKIAKSHSYASIASHRSGETCDDAIADIAIGLLCEYVKFGAPAHGERVAKYNRLLEIEKSL